MLKYQKLANLQEDATECLAGQMNLYLETVAALTGRYAVCKHKCLANNAELRKEIADIEDE